MLLRNNGDPVVVDFGLVRLRGLEATHAGRFAGTPVYSSPEQLRGDVLVGPASDVYSLAVTLYECLTLATPFAGRTTTDLLQRIEQGRFKPLRRLAPDAPRDLETIVAHAMEVDPLQRYADAGAFADDLQRLLELHPIQAKPVSAVRRVEKFFRRNRKTVLAATVGAALVALAILPILHQVQASGRARAAAAEHINQARANVLRVDSGSVEWRHAVWGSSTRPQLYRETNHESPLHLALSHYEQAAALTEETATTQREHRIIKLAIWLRSMQATYAEDITTALDGEEFATHIASLGPVTQKFARTLAGETAAAPNQRHPDQSDLDQADEDDRITTGLLSYLFGDFRTCERAWSRVRSQVRAHPLVDAGLGRLLLADGMLESAYSRLLQAHDRFADSDLITLDLADAALRLGDLELSREWFAQVAPAERVSLTGRRIALDLRAASETSEQLVNEYADLIREDLFDPTARHRLAQLAMRRGDLETARMHLDMLLRNWPEAAQFRLDRARVALQQHDLPGYARQVLAVLEQKFGADRSRGTTADLFEILRIGGLEQLYLEGVATTGHQSAGRAMFGGETPVQGFAAKQLTDNFESLARLVHRVRASVKAARGAEPLLDDVSSQVLLTLPIAFEESGLANGMTWPQRLLLNLTPPLGIHAYDILATPFRNMMVATRIGGWHPLVLTLVPAPPDLSEGAFFGSTILRAQDRTGDGIDELLVACSTPRPENGDARLLLIDGRTNEILESITSDSDSSLFAHALAVSEDLDGDDRQDWIVGSPGSPQADGGFVEIISGAASERLQLISRPDHGFGAAVASLGDCDGDGVPDFAAATVPLVLNAAAHGAIEVFSGATFEPLFEVRNTQPGVWYGACMDNVGDTDGDGTPDLVVGGNYGGASGLVQLLSGRTGEVLHTWTDRTKTSGFGMFVGHVGDTDGDGFGDIVITASSNESKSPDRVFIYSGHTGEQLAVLEGKRRGAFFGKSVVPYLNTPQGTILAIGTPLGGDPISGQVELMTLTGESISVVIGPGLRGAFGWSVLPTSDLDGDQLPELTIGATAGGKNCRIFRVTSTQLFRDRRKR